MNTKEVLITAQLYEDVLVSRVCARCRSERKSRIVSLGQTSPDSQFHLWLVDERFSLCGVADCERSS